jgi:hypothetical protein
VLLAQGVEGLIRHAVKGYIVAISSKSETKRDLR